MQGKESGVSAMTASRAAVSCLDEIQVYHFNSCWKIICIPKIDGFLCERRALKNVNSLGGREITEI